MTTSTFTLTDAELTEALSGIQGTVTPFIVDRVRAVLDSDETNNRKGELLFHQLVRVRGWRNQDQLDGTARTILFLAGTEVDMDHDIRIPQAQA
jgi:hypothetical protein